MLQTIASIIFRCSTHSQKADFAVNFKIEYLLKFTSCFSDQSSFDYIHKNVFISNIYFQLPLVNFNVKISLADDNIFG